MNFGRAHVLFNLSILMVSNSIFPYVNHIQEAVVPQLPEIDDQPKACSGADPGKEESGDDEQSRARFVFSMLYTGMREYLCSDESEGFKQDVSNFVQGGVQKFSEFCKSRSASDTELLQQEESDQEWFRDVAECEKQFFECVAEHIGDRQQCKCLALEYIRVRGNPARLVVEKYGVT